MDGDRRGATIGRDFLAQSRRAIEEGAGHLRDLGFHHQENGRWAGNLTLLRGNPNGERTIQIEVGLPDLFPSALPEVYVRPGVLPTPVAHIEKSGKVCVAPTTGLAVDIRRPAAVIDEVLSRARDVIRGGLSGAIVDDVIGEFLAYWDTKTADHVRSIIDSEGATRPLFAVQVQPPEGNAKSMLLAESREQAAEWTGRVGWKLSDKKADAFLLKLHMPVLPPGFTESPTLGDWLTRLRSACTRSDWTAFQRWLDMIVLPGLLVVSLPIPASSVGTLIGIHLPKLSPSDAQAALKGFRHHKVTAHRQLSFARRYALVRKTPKRLDAKYLRERGGGEALDLKSVTLIGCGSVGGFLAFNLASLGVGRLSLVDPDLMNEENVHRHLLGVAEVGRCKTAAVTEHLNRHFPHQVVEYRTSRIEELLESEPTLLMEADMIVLALGEEALERRLNEALGCLKPRLHTWLEPLGVGGHVLITGRPTDQGCYECLFKDGPQNEAALCAPGQVFARTLAGCAGVHSPFSCLDAARTATEAARAVATTLLGQEAQALLLTWRGTVGEFERQGYTLSPRGARLIPGSTVRHERFGQATCPVCSRWRTG